MSRTAGDYLLNFLCGHAGKYQFQTEFNGLLIYRFKFLRLTISVTLFVLIQHSLVKKKQITFLKFLGGDF